MRPATSPPAGWLALTLPAARSIISTAISGGPGLQPGARSVAELCAALTPLMPAIGDSRADIAIELNWAISEAIPLLAGKAAERLFFAELLPATSHDEVEARAIAALICRSPESVDACIAFAEVEATTLMAGHVEVVLAVANDLISRRTLTGVEIDAIITDHRR